MYGLFSHNIPADGDFEIWKRFKSEEYGFDSDRVVPVSKHTLEESPLKFALAIKMTVLNPYCHTLAEVSAKLMRRAHKKAQMELEQINIYHFERLEFQVRTEKEFGNRIRCFGYTTYSNEMRHGRWPLKAENCASWPIRFAASAPFP